MFTVGYFSNGQRIGLLAFGAGNRAIGGFDPGNAPDGADNVTVVDTDTLTVVFRGWMHPDDIVVREIEDEDGELVFQIGNAAGYMVVASEQHV